MNKKVYLAPQTKVIQIGPEAILAGSGTGATGEDIPWAARRRTPIIDDELYLEEE